MRVGAAGGQCPSGRHAAALFAITTRTASIRKPEDTLTQQAPARIAWGDSGQMSAITEDSLYLVFCEVC
jgi:hypothetical protein